MKYPIFALIPSGYKNFKLYSVLPENGDADMTINRGSSASRVNKDGLIEQVEYYQPRLDYSDSECPSLLIEDAATNLMPYSEDFTQGWNNFNITDTANAEIAPNGALEATKLERTLSSACYTTDSFSKATSAKTYTSSVFVKQGDTPYFAVRSQGQYPARVDLRFEFATKSIYSATMFGSIFSDLTHKVEEYANGWFRLSWTYTTDTANILTGVSMSPRFIDGDADSNDEDHGYVYVWGAQCEEFIASTSYIPTTGTSATRNSDVTETNPVLGDLIDSKKGTMYAEIAATDNVGSFQSVRLCLDGSRTDNSIKFIFSYGGVRVVYRVAGTSTLDWSTVADITEFQKFSISWSEDELVVVVNGEVVATLPLPYLLSGLDLLDAYGGVKIKDWRVWDEVLTQEELIELTS